MVPDSDPYRTLGLTRDATLEEVRRAYRRLAKAHHPDAAGEAALPRFLAIQAAYDTIAGPDAGSRRPGATRPPGPRRAWDAERDRTDATYRAYGGRSRRTRPGANPGAGAGSGGASGPSTERPPGGSRPPGASRPPGSSRPPRSERPPNKATLGSTSYDGADAEPFEPDWGGASWYGTTSGTYWTLNPKEYADPRKHGPEYQARARRELRGRAEADAPLAEVDAEAASDAPAGTAEVQPEATAETNGADGPAVRPASDPVPDRPAPPPSNTTPSWWEATAGHPPRPETTAPGRAKRGDRPFGARPRRTAGPPDVAAAGIDADAVLEAIRAWLDDTHPGAIGRVARAAVGWAPIALGIGWLGGEISGCGRFAAGCDDAVAMTAWVVQIAALLVLLVVGRLARIASVATLATLAAAIPAALLLSATGSPDDAAAGRFALSGLLAIAWVVGLVYGALREVRGTGRGATPPGSSSPARPVS